MSSCEPNDSGILNPVDHPEKRPFGAPGLMYAFYSFVLATGLALVANYVGTIPYLLRVVLLLIAGGCVLESLALMFFEPSVMLGEDSVHYRAQKPSVWQAPPRMFRWKGEYVDEERSLSSFKGVELDYTRVPFPLPVFPFTMPFFYITRWVLTLKREDGSYCLLEVGPTPESFREVAQKVSEYTELPLRAPWFDGFQEEDNGSWLWAAGNDGVVDGSEVNRLLQQTDLAFSKQGNVLEFPVENRLSTFWRGSGLVMAGVCLFAGVVTVFAGFQYDPGTPMGLVLSVFFMLSGVCSATLGLLLLADSVSTVRSTLCFDREGIQVVHPVGQSTFIRYEDLVAVRGVKRNQGSSEMYGLGKPVPCLEVYGEQDWFFISVHDPEQLDRFSQCFRNLT
jgi:hypothetical protein